jgi:hypothetical protein
MHYEISRELNRVWLIRLIMETVQLPVKEKQILSHCYAEQFHNVGLHDKFTVAQLLGHLHTLCFGEIVEVNGLLSLLYLQNTVVSPISSVAEEEHMAVQGKW